MDYDVSANTTYYIAIEGYSSDPTSAILNIVVANGQSCGGSSGTDYDGDGYDDTTDCDDSDSSINPGAYDTPNDGIDQDCDGVDASSGGTDYDLDGYDDTTDCDDYDYYTYPGAAYNESSSACMTDYDGDGYGDDSPASAAITPGTDCDDYDYSIYPGAYDYTGDGIDADCDGVDGSGGSSGSCTADTSISTTGSSVFYTSSSPSGNNADGSCSSYDTDDYWIEFIAPSTGCATIDTNNSLTYDTVLSAYDGCPANGGSELDCDDDGGTSLQSQIIMDVSSSSTYYFAIEGYSTAPYGATLNIAIDTTQTCDGTSLGGGSSCCYSLYMDDSYGDGWNGSYIAAYENGLSMSSHTLSSGYSGTDTICPAAGSSFELEFVSVGIYDYEISFDLYDPSNLYLTSFTYPTTGSVYYTSSVYCP